MIKQPRQPKTSFDSPNRIARASRRAPWQDRGSAGRRVAGLAVVASVALALALTSGRSPAPVTAQVAPAALDGRWTTFANGDDVLVLLEHGGALWAGTRSGGLVRWDTATGEYAQFLKPQDPIGGNTVYDIAADDDGRLWLATDSGLTVYDDHGTKYTSDDYWLTYTVDNSYGMPSDEVRAVAVYGDLVYVGGRQSRDIVTGDWSGGGLGRLDTKGTESVSDDTWAPIATFEDTYIELPDGTDEPGLVSDTINALAVTEEGNLWIGTSPHWRYEDPADPEAPQVLQRVHGGMSFLDTHGTTDPADDTWRGSSCELLELTVTCTVNRIRIDSRGRGWAADGGRGLIHFDPTRGQLPTDPSAHVIPPRGEGSGFVLDFAFGDVSDPDLTNTVWLATRDEGIAVFDHNGTLANRNDDVWNFMRGAPLTMADGLSRDRIQAVAQVGGSIWAGAGIDRGIAGGVHEIEAAGATIDVKEPLRTNHAPPSNFITDIAFGAVGSRWSGDVLVGTGSRLGSVGARLFGAGLAALDDAGTPGVGDDNWTTYDTLSTDGNGAPPWTGLSGDNVQALLLRGDEVWVGSAQTQWDGSSKRFVDGGLSVFDGSQWTARPAGNSASGDELGRGGVSALADGCDDELWLTTGNNWDHRGSGVYALQTGGSIHSTGDDTWQPHRFPQVASANAGAIATDCDRRRVWVGSTHQLNDSETGGPIGQWAKGGVSMLSLGSGAWTKYDTSDGLESYDAGDIDAEIVTIAGGPNGTVWAGAYGTSDMDAASLVATKPYWPAVVNTWNGSAWSHQVLDLAGLVSSVALDTDGRLWVATSRGGAARTSVNPDNWPSDHGLGGLYVKQGSAWSRLLARSHGIPSNDLSVVRVAPDGSVWVGTEGWGLARFEPGAEGPTATPPINMPTRTATPTRDPNEPTPTKRPTGYPTVPPPRPSPTSPYPSPTPRPDRYYIHFPIVPQRA
ncbi:MAG: two-component regulator propeller domain-containing protein [Anaerolineae bacterium]